MPFTAFEHELPNFRQIAWPQPQASARSRAESRVIIPLPLLDPQRVEKGLFGEVVEALARDFLKYEAKQVDSAGVVIENFAGLCRKWLCQDVMIGAGCHFHLPIGA